MLKPWFNLYMEKGMLSNLWDKIEMCFRHIPGYD